jgi:CRISPR-associated protein Csm1
VQFFLQAKILGVERFVESAATSEACAGRSIYISLIGEVLPRALLHSLGLAKELLGTSGGGQFLVVLPGEALSQREEILIAARERLSTISAGELRLIWYATENLGDWSDVRKRLSDGARHFRSSPGPVDFKPRAIEGGQTDPFAGAVSFFEGIGSAQTVGWDPESPWLVVLDGGAVSWLITQEPGIDFVHLARHFAPRDHDGQPASVAELGSRAAGRKVWGVLRGDVDNFGVRLRRAQTIEEHIQFSVFFKQFFAGELQVACSMGDYWRKVSVLYTGGDDFAAYGAWDALIPLSREIQRLFQRSVEEYLQSFPGPEGKTISMAIAVAPHEEASLSQVYAEAGRMLESAKSLGKDSISLLGRTLEWKQLAEAADLKGTMLRLVNEFGCSPEFLGQLGGFYRETDRGNPLRLNRGRADRFDRPWRFYRRLSRVLEGPARDREFQKVRANLLGEFIGKNQAHVKLRPSGRVALEWARFMQEAEQ